ncbi:hypothetical protein OSTOST_11392 [Ostertagia ostertagi]
MKENVLKFLEKVTVKGKCPLAGNSVHFDRRFISKYMPRLDSIFTTVLSTFPRSRSWLPDGFLMSTP